MEYSVKLSKHNEVKSVNPIYFKSLVVSLLYLICTRPYILYTVGLVNRYMENLKTTHSKVEKRVICYIKGTIDFGFLYSFFNDYELVIYNDSDRGRDTNDQKNITGFVFFMADTAFTWMSNKQPIIILSTYQNEYVATTSSICHEIWLKNLLKELSLPQRKPIKICINKKSTIALFKNPIFHDRSMHIDTHYHLIVEYIERKKVQEKYVISHYYITDILPSC